jgi:hypothetical protein
MADQTTEKTPTSPKVETSVFTTRVVISRNGESRTLREETFGKNSKMAGTKFYIFETSVGTFQEDIAFIGTDFLVSSFNRYARKIMGDIFRESFDGVTGVFNKPTYIEKLADFTAGASTLKDLQEDMMELTEQISLFNDKNTEGMESGLDPDGPEMRAIRDEIMIRVNRIKPIRVQMAKIKEKYEKIVETRQSRETAGIATKAA